DFAAAVEQVAQQRQPLLMMGQRTNVDISEQINFSRPTWEQELRAKARTQGQLGPPNAIDYFVFSKGLGSNLLPLAIGRRWWDNWLLWHARSHKATVIDASQVGRSSGQNAQVMTRYARVRRASSVGPLASQGLASSLQAVPAMSR